MVRGDARGLAQLYYENFRPSTTLTYLQALAAQRPYLREEMKDVMTNARKEATVLASRRALAVTPELLQKAMSRCPEAGTTLAAMWVSASRHADLAKIQRARRINGVMMLQWGSFKSDRFGQRAVTKFIAWDRPWPTTWASYRLTVKALKQADPSLSAHSVRRGAVTWLSQQGYSHAEIGALTGHTPTSDPHLAIRRYADPHPSQPESRSQLAMSSALAAALFRHASLA
eukprot:PhM_4_TR18093/c1_g1_i2/m.49222